MTLLREIQEAATDSSVKLSDVLRKAKVLAARLGHQAFKDWVENELNGYRGQNTHVPDYRTFHVQSYGHFVGPFGRALQNAPIPPSCLPKEFRNDMNTAKLSAGVSYYEDLLAHAGPKNPLQSPWPADLTAFMADCIYENMNCLHAWQQMPTSAVAALLDTVRNKILDFVLEIEAQAPDAGEASPDKRPLPQERVSQVFNTYIMGSGNVVAGDVKNISQIQIAPGDLQSLSRFLTTCGIEQPDIAELEEAIKADPMPASPDRFGTRVASWLGKMTAKAASGAIKLSTKVAAEVLSKAIQAHYNEMFHSK